MSIAFVAIHTESCFTLAELQLRFAHAYATINPEERSLPFMEYCNPAKYLLAMAIGHTLLDRKLLKKNEFLAYENIMREKYGLSRASIFRDYIVMLSM